DGLRHGKTVNGFTTTHVWNGSNIVLERNHHGGVVNRFERSHSGRLIRSLHHGWYIHNIRGDVVQRVDNRGGILHTYQYSAFGVEQSPDERNTNPFRFAGEYYDWETGTYYLRARHFNPRTGRFSQPDPFWSVHNFQNGRYAIMQSANLYAFAVNNPVRWIDPSGLFIRDALNSISNAVANIASAVRSSSGSGSSSSSRNSFISNLFFGGNIGSLDTHDASIIDGGGFASGAVYELGRGWRVRIERGVYPNTQRHVHIYNGRQHWSQNEDGSPHDRGGNSPGNPPNRVLRDLKDRTGWDWIERQNNWISQIAITNIFTDGGSFTEVVFPSGTVAYSPHIWGIMPRLSTNTLISLYLNASFMSPSGFHLPYPILPIPMPVPIPAPMPMPIPTFARRFW
ncbi:MAG: RHS repeat-associated core domain-containing protein, partial [Defluviitaleaceae bacterium]|nr:RHS repeat-associated core domain-containing protein [Defluviitaleaceae bacterium]